MAQETNGKGNRNAATLNTATIMKSSLIVSLLVHLTIIIGLQKAFPIDWITKPLQTYHVELLRPPLDPMEEKDKDAAAELSETRPEKSTSAEDTEDTISLETKDKRYASYAKVIKTRLMQHWKYPYEAWENLIEGEVLVLFSLNRQGHLTGIRILQPSSYGLLDKETTRTINAASPFPPFPGTVTVKRLNIKANFTYKLTASR